LKRLVNLRRPSKNFDVFVEWESGQTQPPARAAVNVNRRDWDNRTNSYSEWLTAQLSQDRPVNFTIDQPATRAGAGDFTFLAPINALVCEVVQRDPIQLRDRQIGEITIRAGATLEMTNCFVRKLQILGPVTLKMRHTFIGDLLVNSPIARWSMEYGSILRIQFPAGPEHNFLHMVEFHRVYLPHDPTEFDADPQQYRNARSFLQSNNNTLAAATFHSAELALDRHRETMISRFVSWIYEVFSDYGNSVSRPVLILLFLFVAISALGTIFDATTVGIPPKELSGWQHQLSGPSLEGRALRSATFTLRGIVNPLGIFNIKPLVIAVSIWWSLVLEGLSVLGTLALGLFVVAVRRRFKLW